MNSIAFFSTALLINFFSLSFCAPDKLSNANTSSSSTSKTSSQTASKNKPSTQSNNLVTSPGLYGLCCTLPHIHTREKCPNKK